MKIAVLDGYTLNPGDLSWEELLSLGCCEIHDRTPPDAVVERSLGAEILLTNKTPLSRSQIQQLPGLRYIGILATGTNIVDLQAARDHGIVVSNVPAYGTMSVAQLTFALLLELTNRVEHHARGVRGGRWTACPDFCFWDYALVELSGLTLGLVGFGQIGQAVARMGLAFGMRVLVHVPTPKPGWSQVRFTELETLFRESDVLSLHCPLTPLTSEIVNADRLASMKPGALLLNTARGGLVNEAALANALNTRRLGGAGLDVLSTEPPPADHPLLRTRNCIITPHLAWGTQAARRRLLREAVENIKCFCRGTPRNVVA